MSHLCQLYNGLLDYFFSTVEDTTDLLNQLPNQLILYGIEGNNFATGIELSEAVKQAAETVIQRVLSELEINDVC